MKDRASASSSVLPWTPATGTSQGTLDPSGNEGTLRDHLSLLKPRIVFLLCVVAASGFLVTLARTGQPSWIDLVPLLATGALAAGGSGALNNYYDRDIDPRMDRTRDRPIPAGRIPAWHALVLGIGLTVFALGLGIATLPAESLAWIGAGWLAYLLVYTVGLKRRSVLGVVLGGTAGSFALLAGSAASGGPTALDTGMMALLVAVWTLPHAWAQAIVHVDDFRRVGVATLPARSSIGVASILIVVTGLATVGVALIVAGFASSVYVIGSLLPLAVFVAVTLQLRKQPCRANASLVFRTSNVVLGLLFTLWTIDVWVGATASPWVGLAAAIGTVPALDRVLGSGDEDTTWSSLRSWAALRQRVVGALR